jgi:hypothetical protein
MHLWGKYAEKILGDGTEKHTTHRKNSKVRTVDSNQYVHGKIKCHKRTRKQSRHTDSQTSGGQTFYYHNKCMISEQHQDISGYNANNSEEIIKQANNTKKSFGFSTAVRTTLMAKALARQTPGTSNFMGQVYEAERRYE